MSSSALAPFHLDLFDRAGTHVASLLAEEHVLFLGEDFLPWMVLAFGAALVVGNVLALVRPPNPDGSRSRSGAADDVPPADEPMERPPMARTVVMIVVGLVAAGWGLASLLA
ncbi:MAG: hypothetical protein M3Y51_06245 [Actinomycetota bacterium]|nr:hypothetical protein [Actinomycetota bacterium]